MQPGARRDDAEAHLAALQRASAALQAEGARLLVWPEATYPVPLPIDNRRDLAVDHPWRIRRGFDVPVVVGLVARRGERAYNAAMLLDGEAVAAVHAKVHRMIGTEFNPLVEWFPSLGAYLPAGFAAGDGPVPLPVTIDGRPLRLGPLICVEDVIPRYARALAALRPHLLVNLTNDTWFGTGAEPWQHRALAALRAVEVRGDLVRAVNTGPSGLVEATGRIGPHTPVRAPGHPAEGIVVTAALMEAGHTAYAALGDLFAWLCVALTAVAWVVGRRAVRRGAGR
jgi:apolipoprotein N-acyltransferase